jgi:hypothetical protein
VSIFFGKLGGAIFSRGMCDYRRGMDWRMDLLTNYTHDLELRALTALSLVSTAPVKPTSSLLCFLSTVP